MRSLFLSRYWVYSDLSTSGIQNFHLISKMVIIFLLINCELNCCFCTKSQIFFRHLSNSNFLSHFSMSESLKDCPAIRLFLHLNNLNVATGYIKENPLGPTVSKLRHKVYQNRTLFFFQFS